MDFNYNLNNSLQSTDTSVVRTQEFITRSPVKIKALSFYIQRLAIRERGGTLSFKILDNLNNELGGITVLSFSDLAAVNGQWITGVFSTPISLPGGGIFKAAVDFRPNGLPNLLQMGSQDLSPHPGGNLIFSILGEVDSADSGKAFLASARNADSIRNMLGFAVNNASAGGMVIIAPLIFGQKIPGFLGLISGQNVYPSDTAGKISNTPGWLESSIGAAISDTEIITKPPRRAYNFVWKSPTENGGTSTIFGTHRFILPLSPRRITINAPFSNNRRDNIASGISIGAFNDGSQSVASINHSNSFNSIKSSSATGKIIQWIGGNDLEKTTASIVAVDSISFTMSFSGAMDAGSHYLISVSAEE